MGDDHNSSRWQENANRWREGIRDLFSGLPADYSNRRSQLEAISHLFHEEMGRLIGPALIQETATLKSMDDAQRREWAFRRNEDLRRLHLAWRDPAGRPAILTIESNSSEPVPFDFQASEKNKAAGSLAGASLPEIVIIEDNPHFESLVNTTRTPRRAPKSR